MADKPKKPQKLRARLPRGLEDRGPAAIAVKSCYPITRDREDNPALRINLADAMVVEIGNVEIAACVQGDAVRR